VVYDQVIYMISLIKQNVIYRRYCFQLVLEQQQ